MMLIVCTYNSITQGAMCMYIVFLAYGFEANVNIFSGKFHSVYKVNSKHNVK